MRRQPGFVALFGCFESTSGEIVCVTLWQTEDDASTFEATSGTVLEQFRWIIERPEATW